MVGEGMLLASGGNGERAGERLGEARSAAGEVWATQAASAASADLPGAAGVVRKWLLGPTVGGSGCAGSGKKGVVGPSLSTRISQRSSKSSCRGGRESPRVGHAIMRAVRARLRAHRASDSYQAAAWQFSTTKRRDTYNTSEQVHCTEVYPIAQTCDHVSSSCSSISPTQLADIFRMSSSGRPPAGACVSGLTIVMMQP